MIGVGFTFISFGLVRAIFSPPFWLIHRLVPKGVIVKYGEREGADEIGMMGDEIENGEASCERVFTVGGVVEFWEGSFVCGKRTDSGSPAFVKRVEGNGLY